MLALELHAAGLAVAQADYVIRDFRFSTGETLPELRLHYSTLGKPERDANDVVRNAVLVLHGTTGAGASFLNDAFAGTLFGRDSRSTRPATTSSCRTQSVTANRASRAAVCVPGFRAIRTRTW